MNFRQVFEAREDSFQIAPLIDVVFLLLTFFILTGALEAQERESRIRLPSTTSAVVRRRGPDDVVVNVTKQGNIWVNNRHRTIEQLRQILKALRRSGPVPVVIRAHAETRHRHVMQVIDACAGADVRRVMFVSRDPRDKPIR